MSKDSKINLFPETVLTSFDNSTLATQLAAAIALEADPATVKPGSDIQIMQNPGNTGYALNNGAGTIQAVAYVNASPDFSINNDIFAFPIDNNGDHQLDAFIGLSGTADVIATSGNLHIGDDAIPTDITLTASGATITVEQGQTLVLRGTGDIVNAMQGATIIVENGFADVINAGTNSGVSVDFEGGKNNVAIGNDIAGTVDGTAGVPATAAFIGQTPIITADYAQIGMIGTTTAVLHNANNTNFLSDGNSIDLTGTNSNVVVLDGSVPNGPEAAQLELAQNTAVSLNSIVQNTTSNAVSSDLATDATIVNQALASAMQGFGRPPSFLPTTTDVLPDFSANGAGIQFALNADNTGFLLYNGKLFTFTTDYTNPVSVTIDVNGNVTFTGDADLTNVDHANFSIGAGSNISVISHDAQINVAAGSTATISGDNNVVSEGRGSFVAINGSNNVSVGSNATVDMSNGTADVALLNNGQAAFDNAQGVVVGPNNQVSLTDGSSAGAYGNGDAMLAINSQGVLLGQNQQGIGGGSSGAATGIVATNAAPADTALGASINVVEDLSLTISASLGTPSPKMTFLTGAMNDIVQAAIKETTNPDGTRGVLWTDPSNLNAANFGATANMLTASLASAIPADYLIYGPQAPIAYQPGLDVSVLSTRDSTVVVGESRDDTSLFAPLYTPGAYNS